MSFDFSIKRVQTKTIHEGLSLESLRNATTVMLYLKTSDNVIKCVYRAITNGDMSFSAGVQKSTFGNFLTNGNMGPYWATMMKSLGASSAVAMPVKPYIQGAKPIEFSVTTILPLILPIESQKNWSVKDCFKNNIKQQYDNLMLLTVPAKDTKSAKFVTTLTEKLKGWSDELFDSDKKFWQGVNDITKGMIDDFFKDMYLLKNPIQYRDGNNLTLYIGNDRYPDLFIENVNVTIPRHLYMQNNISYPAYFEVKIDFSTRNNATVDLFTSSERIKEVKTL